MIDFSNPIHYFITVPFVIMILTVYWIDADGTHKYPMPHVARYQPLTLAVLEKELLGLVTAALVDLMKSDLLCVGKDDVGPVLITKEGDVSWLPPAEVEVYQALRARACHPFDLFKTFEQNNALSKYIADAHAELKEAHLMRSDSEMSIAKKKGVVASIIVGMVFLGGLYLKPRTDFWNLDSLLVLLPLTFFLRCLLKKMPGPVTGLGDRYRIALRKSYSPVYEELTAGTRIDISFGAAIGPSGMIALKDPERKKALRELIDLLDLTVLWYSDTKVGIIERGSEIEVVNKLPVKFWVREAKTVIRSGKLVRHYPTRDPWELSVSDIKRLTLGSYEATAESNTTYTVLAVTQSGEEWRIFESSGTDKPGWLAAQYVKRRLEQYLDLGSAGSEEGK